MIKSSHFTKLSSSVSMINTWFGKEKSHLNWTVDVICMSNSFDNGERKEKQPLEIN